MRIAVIGGSAGVGLEVVKQLIESGDYVATLSRRTDSIPDSPQVTKVQGSALNEADVLRTIEGADAVLVALGTGMSTTTAGLYPKASQALLNALANSPNKPPVIVLTGFGAGNSWNYNSFLMKMMFNLLLKDVYAEKTQMEQLMSGGYSNSMFVRPGRLTNGALTQKYRVTTDLDKSTRISAISRKDVAHFMIQQAKHPTYIGKYAALSY
jgi:putative NADH-flavin reductase